MKIILKDNYKIDNDYKYIECIKINLRHNNNCEVYHYLRCHLVRKRKS